MIVRYSILLCALALIFFGTPSFADEAQDALVELGVAAYDDGDYQRAKSILLPLAEAVHPKAMHYLGRMNKFGQGFTENLSIGCDWYERSANAGYADAMYNMSICYDGFGRPNDPEMNKAWLLKAAQHGIPDAMINLAGLDQSQDEQYRLWMNMAARHGSKYAIVSLWLQGYKDDVPNIKIQDIACVSVRILILDEYFDVCD